MYNSFILRFQEGRGDDPRIAQIVSEAEKRTNVMAKQAGSQTKKIATIPNRSCQATPTKLQIIAGTKTLTEIRQESADADPTKHQFDSLPRI